MTQREPEAALAEALRSTQHTITRVRTGDGPWQEFDDRENRELATAILAALSEYQLVRTAEIERLRRIEAAAQDVVTRWFDWIEGEADQTLRQSMIRLRAALEASEEPR